jgi:hypothetical protein
MTNQLATITPSETEYAVIREQAASLVKTGFLPAAIKTPEQALAIILTGRELGIPAMAALNTINVIQGKPTVSPQLMLALIERSGQLDDIRIDSDDVEVTVMMKRKGRTPHTEAFGWEQAKAMQLATKDNYRKQAFVMFKWRAVSACARVVFPDVILGLYTHEEMSPDSQVNEDGEILDLNLLSQPTPKNSEGRLPVVDAVVEPVEAKKPKGKKAAKGVTVTDAERKEALIAYCGQGFRALNDLNIAERWTLATINEFILTEFGVEGGIHNLDVEQVQRLAELIDGIYRLHTEGYDNPEVINAEVR